MNFPRPILLASLLCLPLSGRAQNNPDDALEAFYQAHPDLDRRFGQNYRDAFGGSAAFRTLARSGALQNAVISRGDPPGVVFPVSVQGRLLRAAYYPASQDPPRDEKMLLLDQRNLVFAVAAEQLADHDPSSVYADALKGQPVGSGNAHADDLRDAVASNPGILQGGERALTGARATALGTQAPITEPPPDRVRRAVEYGPDGSKVHVRYETRGGQTRRIVYAQETAYGTRFLEDQEPGVESYSRTIGGQTLFLRYENGIPSVTHVMRNGEWTPFSGELPEEQREPFLQKIGDTLYAYRLDAKGKGVRTHQALEDGGHWAWFLLADGKPLAAPAQGASRRLVRTDNATFLVEFSAGGTNARVTHVGGPEDGDTLHSQTSGTQGPSSFEASSHGRAADGSPARYWFSFSRDASGKYAATLTHQWIGTQGDSGGWIRLSGGKPLEADDLATARQIIALESRVEGGRARAEAQRRRGEAGLAAYPRVASLASGILGPPPAAITEEEVRRRAGEERRLEIPGVPGAQIQVVLSPAQGQGSARRQLIVVAGSPEQAAQLQKFLERYKQELGRQVAEDGLGGIGRVLLGRQSLLPDQVTVVLATHDSLERNIAEVNQDIGRMPLLAAGQGALENSQSGRGERNLEHPGILGVRGRIAARRVAGSAAANSGRAQSQMIEAREEAADLIGEGLQASRLRAGLEAALAFRAAGVRSVTVADAGNSESLLHDYLGSAAVPYRLQGGGIYLHRMQLDSSELPSGPEGSAVRLAAAVDYRLSQLAHDHPQGIPRAEIERVWSEQIRRVYGGGVSAEQAAGYARGLLAPPAPRQISRSESQPVANMYRASNGFWYATGPRQQWYYFTGRYDSDGQEIWVRSR